MELSCKSEYALLALLDLASHYSLGEPVQIRKIAADKNIPDRYLEQLLAILRRAGLVRAQRGAKGGYILAREARQISLFEIISCLEGFEKQEPKRQDSLLETVVIDELWQEVNQAAQSVLRCYTLQDLVDRTQAKRELDLMYYI
jgi:Rrf2 family transcriptional regulator, cysteine metabolism repressor